MLVVTFFHQIIIDFFYLIKAVGFCFLRHTEAFECLKSTNAMSNVICETKIKRKKKAKTTISGP